ncbi:MAG: metallophosphoesterase [Cyanobacteria bacterium MAG COS3_bin_20]|nr:metallophosphoesterase [Cyanobacteria bacterium MAG COS3_bin_20]
MLQLVLGTGLTAAALPLSAARGAVQRVGLISDLNSSYGSTRYIPAVDQGLDQLIGLQPDLVVCAGDMVAGQMRGLTVQQLDAMWRGFETSVLQRLQAAKIPLLPAIGNHDGSPGFPADRAAVGRFWTPIRSRMGLVFVDASQFPFRYSVLQDGIFWLVWDASSARVPEDQLVWAQQQLASPHAQMARARFVVGHLPLAGVGLGKDRPGEVLERGHALQAWFSSRRGQLDLIQLGALGSGPRRLLRGEAPAQQSFTLLEIDGGRGTLRETTYAVSTGRPISWSTLPLRLNTRAGLLQRNASERLLRG